MSLLEFHSKKSGVPKFYFQNRLKEVVLIQNLTAVLFKQHYAVNYCHRVLDDLFGIFVLLKEHGLMNGTNLYTDTTPVTEVFLLLYQRNFGNILFDIFTEVFPISRIEYTDATNNLQCYKRIWAGVQTFESCHLHMCKRGYSEYPDLDGLLVRQKDLLSFRLLMMNKVVNTKLLHHLQLLVIQIEQ